MGGDVVAAKDGAPWGLISACPWSHPLPELLVGGCAGMAAEWRARGNRGQGALELNPLQTAQRASWGV
jgi:hypothetical protein